MAYIIGEIGVIATGNVTQEPETKLFGKNKEYSLIEFNISLGKDKINEKKYLKCQAKFDMFSYAEALQKGDRVFVSGTLEAWEYEGKEYSKLDIDYLDIKRKENQEKKKDTLVEKFSANSTNNDDDLPF